MSALPVTPSAPTTARRPGVLVAAIGISVVTALAALANGIMIATGGKELIRDLLVQAGMPESMSDGDLELATQIAGYASLDDFVSTFAMRGYLVAGAGAALLVFGLLMRGAAKWARILVTLSAVATMLFSVIVLGDETTSAMAGLAMFALVGGVLAIVFTWLPANNRYAKAGQ